MPWEEYKDIVAWSSTQKNGQSLWPFFSAKCYETFTSGQIEAQNKNPNWEHKKVDFVFDEQAEVGLRLRHWYGPLKANMQEPYKQMMGNTPDFRDDEDVVALQAADMLAWHVRHKLECPEDARPILKQITEHYGEIEIDADALRDFVEHCKRVDPKYLEDLRVGSKQSPRCCPCHGINNLAQKVSQVYYCRNLEHNDPHHAAFAKYAKRMGHAPAPGYLAHLSNSDLSHAAVYVDFNARDVGRILRSQERHRTGHFLGLSKPLHRNLRH